MDPDPRTSDKVTEGKLVKARVALIEDIRKAGGFWKACAESAALAAIRKPGDKDAASHAREMVIKLDASQALADEAIKLVWKHWPKEGG